MAITTDASIAEAKTTMLAQNLLTNLTHENVLAQFFKSDSDFINNAGAYGLGQTISIPVVPTVTTNIVTATGGAVSYPKQTLTNVSLTLDYIAQSSLSINEADLALANVDPTNSTVTSAASNHGNAIEEQLFLAAFNDASIDANQLGSAATAANYKLLRTLWQSFFEANVSRSETKVVVLPGDQYAELLADTTVSRLANPDQSSTLNDGFLLKTLNMIVLPSNATPTLTELTALTGTGSTGVGFAFTIDSVAGAVRELSTSGNGLGVRQVVVRNNDINIATRFTESYNPDVVGGDKRYNIETLFGAKVYRPTTVFPVLGGVA